MIGNLGREAGVILKTILWRAAVAAPLYPGIRTESGRAKRRAKRRAKTYAAPYLPRR